MAKLITTIQTLQQYVKVNNGLQMDSVNPGLNEIELQVLPYYLSQELLDIIIAQHEAQNFTARITAIYPYVMQAEGNLGVHKAVNEIEVQVDDSGINRIENQNQKTAYGGQIARYKETIGNRGWAAIDALLLVLENDSANYSEWLNSDYYAMRTGLVFTNAADFNRYENIKSSGLTFLALSGYIKDAIDTLQYALPSDMYDNILSENVSVENKALVNKYLKVYLAKMAMHKALMELPVVVDHMGVTVKQLELNSGDNRSRKMAPNMYIERKMVLMNSNGMAALSRMTDFLNSTANESSYATWFNSNFYDEPWATKVANNALTEEERNIYRA